MRRSEDAQEAILAKAAAQVPDLDGPVHAATHRPGRLHWAAVHAQHLRPSKATS